MCSWFSWGCSGFSWECSGFFGSIPGFSVLPECSVLFQCSGVPCSGVPGSTTCRLQLTSALESINGVLHVHVEVN